MAQVGATGWGHSADGWCLARIRNIINLHDAFLTPRLSACVSVCVRMSALIVSCTEGGHGQNDLIVPSLTTSPLLPHPNLPPPPCILFNSSLSSVHILLFPNKCPFPPSPPRPPAPLPRPTSSATAAVTHLAHQNTRIGSLSRTPTFHVIHSDTETPDPHTHACTVYPPCSYAYPNMHSMTKN